MGKSICVDVIFVTFKCVQSLVVDVGSIHQDVVSTKVYKVSQLACNMAVFSPNIFD